MSQKEKEELELKEMKMNQFHAKAVGETLPRSVGLYYFKNFFDFFFFKCKKILNFPVNFKIFIFSHKGKKSALTSYIALIYRKKCAMNVLKIRDILFIRWTLQKDNLYRYNYGEVEKRPCTIPQPFNLAIASKPFAKPQLQEEHVEPFHSRPLNKKILQGPTGWDPSVPRIYFIFIRIRDPS